MSLHRLSSEASGLVGQARELNQVVADLTSALGIPQLPRSDAKNALNMDLASEVLVDISSQHASVRDELEYAESCIRQIFSVLISFPEQPVGPQEGVGARVGTTHVIMEESGASAGAGFVTRETRR